MGMGLETFDERIPFGDSNNGCQCLGVDQECSQQRYHCLVVCGTWGIWYDHDSFGEQHDNERFPHTTLTIVTWAWGLKRLINGFLLVTVTMDASVRVVTNIVPNKDIAGWLYVEHVKFEKITKRLDNKMTMNSFVPQLRPLSSESGSSPV